MLLDRTSLVLLASSCDNFRYSGGPMKKTSLALLICLTLFAVSVAAAKKSAGKTPATPDKAYLQKIWDGWSTLNAANVAQFYASGPHTFFDIAPLKYSSWDEYQKTVGQELADYRSAKFTVNDDAELHAAGNYVWGTATRTMICVECLQPETACLLE